MQVSRCSPEPTALSLAAAPVSSHRLPLSSSAAPHEVRQGESFGRKETNQGHQGHFQEQETRDGKGFEVSALGSVKSQSTSDSPAGQGESSPTWPGGSS